MLLPAPYYFVYPVPKGLSRPYFTYKVSAGFGVGLFKLVRGQPIVVADCYDTCWSEAEIPIPFYRGLSPVPI